MTVPGFANDHDDVPDRHVRDPPNVCFPHPFRAGHELVERDDRRGHCFRWEEKRGDQEICLLFIENFKQIYVYSKALPAKIQKFIAHHTQTPPTPFPRKFKNALDANI